MVLTWKVIGWSAWEVNIGQRYSGNNGLLRGPAVVADWSRHGIRKRWCADGTVGQRRSSRVEQKIRGRRLGAHITVRLH